MNRVFIFMGVSGCGKTTVGKKLSQQLGIPFYDADDFHSQESIDKMESGTPLTDEDRKPWLTKLAENIMVWGKDRGAVLACSALKEKYRQILASQTDHITWIYLSGSYDLIKERMKERTGHYMPANLLQSQFEALEEPVNAIKVDISLAPEEIVNLLIQKLKLHE